MVEYQVLLLTVSESKMCNKVVDNFVHTLEFVPDCCKTKKSVIRLCTIIVL